MGGKIFVNYRQSQEGGWAAEVIATRLKAKFGDDRVFLDAHNIRPSDEFAAVIDQELESALAFVVVLGKDWHKIQDEKTGNKRIDEENDWVRKEIRTAIRRKLRIFIILLEDAALPEETWIKEDIRAFLRHQKVTVRQATADADLSRVFQVLAEIPGLSPLDAGVRTPPAAPRQAPAAVRRTPSATLLPSRVPIVIAIEHEKKRLTEQDLLAAERHLTITLDEAAVAALKSIHDGVLGATSLQAVHDLGRQAWFELSSASNRLERLLSRVRSAERRDGHPQPIAWTGRADLLASIHRAVLVAYFEDGESGAFVTTAQGAHYFHPLRLPAISRWMQPREDAHRRAGIRVGAVTAADGEPLPRDISAALGSEIMLLKADNLTDPLHLITELIPRQPRSPTRVVLGFGGGNVPMESIESVLTSFPCLSVAGPRIPALLNGSVDQAIRYGAKTQAVPVIVGRSRAALIDELVRDGECRDMEALREAVTWSTWSWVGRPLFAEAFGEIPKAAYPHLMDLRDVASSDWYFERTGDIAPPYRTESLTGRNPKRPFHLYLSGAGGTGKSCFLRFIYEKLEDNESQVLPIWYKVHAPSSDWKDLDRQIKSEVRGALARRLPGSVALVSDADDRKDLGKFLVDVLERLQASTDLKQLVLFIDQLERTFESGDNPELRRLTTISAKVVELLKQVGTEKGIRVFLASRKQYLADFLSSFDKAEEINLHFNVLQTLSSEREGAGFVERILDWCNRNQLTRAPLRMGEDAAHLLAMREEGHPLNMMLALIQIISMSDLPEEIGEATINERRPWEQRFYVDEALASKDDLDWYFFLAMAHARTEIVRREEVLWRVGLVSRELARRRDELGPNGVLERLWLLGHLGRTVHPRPMLSDAARFFEFFHANLRDHLITNVMNRAEESDEDRREGIVRRRGMPPAWRALDRLREIARDWQQVQQPLLREDISVLMDRKDVFTEKIEVSRDGKSVETEAFYLLFMRDVSERRDDHFEAAKECIAYSALVHDVFGRWAIKTLFPTVARDAEREGKDSSQVGCCRRWLGRADSQSRRRILQYLVELRDVRANKALAEAVFQRTSDEPWQQLAGILAEALVASTHRSAFIAYLIQYLLDQGISFPAEDWHTARFGAFLVAACGGERDEVFHLFETLVKEAAILSDRRLEPALRELGDASRLERWIGAPGASTDGLAVSATDVVTAEIELRVGEALAALLDKATVDRWNEELAASLDIPLPPITLSLAEVSTHRRTIEANRKAVDSGFELELLIRGRLIALGKFFPDRVQTLSRDWDVDPDGAITAYNEALCEPVRWVREITLEAAHWKYRQSSFDRAVSEWLELLLRRWVPSVFNYDDVFPYLTTLAQRATASRVSPLDLRGLSNLLYPVWTVLARLVREHVPMGRRGADVLVRLLELVRESSALEFETLTRQLREHVSEDLCRAFVDDTNQLTLLFLDPADERWLEDKLVINSARHSFKLTPEEALRMVGAIRDRFEAVTRAQHAPPVLVCEDHLRSALFALLQRFDPRLFVLSYTELSPEVRLTSSGFVQRVAPKEGVS